MTAELDNSALLQLEPVLVLQGLHNLHFRVLRSSTTTRQSAAYASRSLPGAQAALPAPSPLKPTTPSNSRSGGAASAPAKTTKGLGAYMGCRHAPALSGRCHVNLLLGCKVARPRPLQICCTSLHIPDEALNKAVQPSCCPRPPDEAGQPLCSCSTPAAACIPAP